MIMEDTFAKLKSLQDILVEEYNISSKITAGPKQLEDQEQLLLRLKSEFVQMGQASQEIKEKIGQLKVELDQAQKLREDGEKGMDNITTHREYEALEKQIEDAKIREDELRHDISREEKKRSDIDEKIKSTESLMQAQESELKENKAELDMATNALNDKLNNLKNEEAQLTPGIGNDIIFKFRRIIERNKKGIVPVKGNVCAGCHMILPAQFANEVRDGDKILFCPYCSRILYYEETDNNEAEEFFSTEDTGSLADLDEDFDEEEEEDSNREEMTEDEGLSEDFDN